MNCPAHSNSSPLCGRPAGRDGRPAGRPYGRRLWLALVCLLIVALVQTDSISGRARERLLINRAIGEQGFAFPAWEAQALAQKARDMVTRPGADLSPEGQQGLVETYFDGIERADDLTAQVERIYADPKVADPATASAALQTELDALRREQAERRPAVERIIEQQIAAIVQEAELTTPLPGIERGVTWPPVRFQFTASPAVLILSPRSASRWSAPSICSRSWPLPRWNGSRARSRSSLISAR